MAPRRTRGPVWTHAERQELENTITPYGTDITAQQTRLEEHDSRLAAIETNVAATQSAIQTRADQEAEQMRQLQAKIDILEGEMRRLKRSIEAPSSPLPNLRNHVTPAVGSSLPRSPLALNSSSLAAHTRTPSIPGGASPTVPLSVSRRHVRGRVYTSFYLLRNYLRDGSERRSFEELMRYLGVADDEPDWQALHQMFHSLPPDHEVRYDHETRLFYYSTAEHAPNLRAMSADTPHQAQTNVQQQPTRGRQLRGTSTRPSSPRRQATPGRSRQATPGPSRPPIDRASRTISPGAPPARSTQGANPTDTFEILLAEDLAPARRGRAASIASLPRHRLPAREFEQLLSNRSNIRRRGSAPACIERRKSWDTLYPKSRRMTKARLRKVALKVVKIGMCVGAAAQVSLWVHRAIHCKAIEFGI